ncbi:Cysteine desulfurase [Kingella kingae]|nr:Cysteine desulfurase [Kingella kingae]
MTSWRIHRCGLRLGRMTTEEEVKFAAELIKSKIGKLRELSPLWEMFKDGIDLSTVEWGGTLMIEGFELACRQSSD